MYGHPRMSTCSSPRSRAPWIACRFRKPKWHSPDCGGRGTKGIVVVRISLPFMLDRLYRVEFGGVASEDYIEEYTEQAGRIRW